MNDGEIINADRYKVHPGEPGWDVATDFVNGGPVVQENPLALVSPLTPSLPSIPQQQIQSVPSLLSRRDEIAHYRLIFVRALEADISKGAKSVLEAVRQFLIGYNSGYLLPAVYKKVGPVSFRTAYRFREAYDKGGIESLVPEYGKKGVFKITEDEKNVLLAFLLHHRLKVAYAITLTKNHLKKRGVESPSSERTLRRFANEFKKKHYDIWVLYREGEKALDDKVLPFIERDRNLIDVGEGLVADGHRLNFQVINPFTGKPCRAAMILFWDWRSAYPLGWEIMLEESVQCIASALRNTILTLGKIPKWILMDNGKAFRAKIFTSCEDIAETELVGIFARLGIHIHFAQPYNAKAKPVERFFETFTDWFERLLPSFIGASIDDKPAWLRRNEKLAQSLHSDWIPRIDEVNELILSWREFYADQPSRGLEGKTPKEVLNSRLDGNDGGIDAAELTYLMMAREIKTVHRNGFTLFGCNWYNEELYGYREPILVKYTLSDLSHIFCFTLRGEFLCTVNPVEKVHPMASEGGTPKDIEAVKRLNARKRSLKNQTVKLHKLLGQKSAQVLPWREIVQEIPNMVETIEKIEAEKPKPKIISPFPNDLAAPVEVGTEDKNEIVIDNEPGQSDPVLSPDSLRFKYAWERYDYLLSKDQLTEMEERFIAEYKAGEVAPGEWESIYGERRER